MKNKAQPQLQAGDVIHADQEYYRILVLTEKTVIFVQLDVSRINIIRFSTEFLKYRMNLGEFEKVDWNDDYRVKNLTLDEEEEIARKAKAMEHMLQSMYPAWERISSKETKPEVKALMQELGCRKTTVYKLIRLYLQSGRNRYSLVDGRKGEKNRVNDYKIGDSVRGHGDKTVANDERLEEIFKDGYSHFLKGKEAGVSLKSSYRYLIGKYYMTQEYDNGALVQKMAPLEEIPTYKRFWTYCNKQNDRNGITPLKMSAKERRNNNLMWYKKS